MKEETSIKNFNDYLYNQLSHYHQLIRNIFNSYWKLYKAGEKPNEENLLNLFYTPRQSFIKFCKSNNLNYSSVAGTIQEWTLFHFLNAGLSFYKKDSIAQVINRFQIPFKWKKKGNKKINLDVVINNNRTNIIYYAFEIKTNFEDGFYKYLSEENIIYHLRQRTYPYFKYYYISLTKPTKSIERKYKRKVNTLIKRKELYVLNKNRCIYPGIKEFIKSISKAIIKIK
jgi:hypothetical protein